MSDQTVIPRELLEKSNKILFVAHLAIGDFTYLQNCFRAFSENYPHIKVHLWVDETRRTRIRSKWKYLEKNSLYDWLAECPYFEKVYTRTYSPQLFSESLREAREERYPIVVSLANLRAHFYAGLSRAISPYGFVAGVKRKFKFSTPHHYFSFRKLDAAIPPFGVSRVNPQHVSDLYAERFCRLFGFEIPVAERFPFVRIPDGSIRYADEQLARWGFDPGKERVVFVNPFATNIKRCWPVKRVAELIIEMRKHPEWKNACFIVNSIPQELENVRKIVDRYKLEQTEVFTAENFFQLPAMLGRCHLIISVETAVMHLANAVKVPVVALMRTKTLQWTPIDRENSTVITCAKRDHWVKHIGVEEVLEKI